MSAFLRYDQLPTIATVPDDALVAVWSGGALYVAPRSAVGGGGGGGGGGGYETVQANGADLTQRDTLNVTGLLQASDSGGRTLLHLPSIALGSQVSGLLPVSSGGTGAALSGALQSVRMNAANTALELYTPGSGLNAPASPGDNGKPAVASGGNLVYSLLTTAHLSPSAGIANTQLASMNATRLIGRDIGAGTPIELTVGGGVEFTGSGGLQRSAITGDVGIAAGSATSAIGTKKVTRPMLADAAAKGQSLWFGDSGWQQGGPKTRATDLGDANATLAAADGARAVLPATTLTSARQGQFSLAGATEKLIYSVERYDLSAFTYTIKNSLGVTIHTFLAGAAAAAVFQYTSGEWVLVSHFPIV